MRGGGHEAEEQRTHPPVVCTTLATRIASILASFCSTVLATTQNGSLRGITSDPAYTEQFHTALAVPAYLNGAIPAEERLASFAAIPRLIHVAGTLDSFVR